MAGYWAQKSMMVQGDTYKAGVLATFGSAGTNHVSPDVRAEVWLFVQMVTHGVVDDSYLHFLEDVGKWQTCVGDGRQRDRPLDPLLLEGMA